MTWSDIVEGNIVYKLQFNDDLSISLVEETVISIEVNIISLILLSSNSKLTVSNPDDLVVNSLGYLTVFPKITDFIFYYPDKTQLFNKIKEDFKDAKSLYDKSIEDISNSCIRLLNRKELLINKLQSKIDKDVEFYDYIKLGNFIYANVYDKIAQFTIVDVGLDSVTAISLEDKKMVNLNIEDNRFGKSFEKNNVTYYLTRLEAETYGEIDRINYDFDNTQDRLEELTTESDEYSICIKNLENYEKD